MKQLLASDICRCMGHGCKEYSECLRYTDRPEGRYSMTTSLQERINEPCTFKITLKEIQ